MEHIDFVKMVGSGNDFIVIDTQRHQSPITNHQLPDFVREICQRKKSIGADGVLLLGNSKIADIKMRIFNPDGSEVDMCGNGSRCVALYAHQNKIGSDRKIIIETRAGNIQAEVQQDSVKIKMSPPRDLRLEFNLDIDGQFYNVNHINTGVPHVVWFVEELDGFNVEEMGRAIRYHTEFQPQGTNADFVEVLDKNHIRIRTYERGVERETLSCGTGCIAASIISTYEMEKEPQGTYKIEVYTQSGEVLTVYFNIEHNLIHKVFLEGQAKIVYRGEMKTRFTE